jgi:four helix bundle protein
MNYRDLGFYQKSRKLTQGVNDEINKWPKSMQSQEISRQLFRSVISIGANIAEGHGRHVGLEYIHYLIIAQGSANEVDHWLNTALDRLIGERDRIKPLVDLNDEIRKMLTSTITTLQRKQGEKFARETSIPYSPNPYSPVEEDETL